MRRFFNVTNRWGVYRFHFRSAVKRENLGQLLKIRNSVAATKTDFTRFKVFKWGWYYLSTVLMFTPATF